MVQEDGQGRLLRWQHLPNSLFSLGFIHMNFENFQPTLKEPLPRLDDDEDEDEGSPESVVAKKDQSVSLLIQKRFLNQRKIFLWGPVTDESAKDLCEKLLYLESTGAGKEITFYMNTPGGSITAGMAVFDTMKLITAPITIVVTGMAASMGSILLCAAAKGRRLIYPHGRVLIHQPLISGRFIGPATDINIQAQEMEKIRAELNQILATASGQPLEKITRDSDRDFYLNANEAVKYGLADAIFETL
jgi:ATP-dependent Clp protease protease subunit